MLGSKWGHTQELATTRRNRVAERQAAPLPCCNRWHPRIDSYSNVRCSHAHIIIKEFTLQCTGLALRKSARQGPCAHARPGPLTGDREQ